jgi:hypothetical protein
MEAEYKTSTRLSQTAVSVTLGCAFQVASVCCSRPRYGKDYGSFSSPDYPQRYQDNINCLLYAFIATRDEIIEITFKDFDVQKSHLE